MRPRDWHPLAAADPLPGDPVQVAAAARRYADLAVEIERQAADLVAMAHDIDLESEAVEALQVQAQEVGRRLARAGRRYRTVGAALRTWGPALQECQERGDAALARAQRAQRAIDALPPERVELFGELERVLPSRPQVDVGPARPDPSRIEAAARAEAEDEIRAARRMLHDAQELRDDAGRRAVEAVRRAGEGDGLDDSRLDRVTAQVAGAAGALLDVVRVLSPQLAWIAEALSTVSTVAGLLAMTLALIPTFAAAAGVLAVAGLVAAVVVLAIHAAMWAAGTATGGQVAKDALGVVLGRFGARGLGRATTGLKAAVGRVEAGAAANAVRATHAGAAGSAQRVVASAHSGPVSKAYAQRVLDRIEAKAAREHARALRAAVGRTDPALGRADRRLVVQAGGDIDAAKALKLAQQARGTSPLVPDVARAVQRVEDQARWVGAARGTGLALGGGEQGHKAYGLTKDRLEDLRRAPRVPAGAR